MKIFFRLLLAHLLADFTLQTNYIAKWKKEKFLGVVFHSTIFLALALIFTYKDVHKIWFDYPIKLSGIWCLLILFLLHIIEDEYRAYNVRRYHINDTILFFFWDQIIHIVFLFVFSPYREGEPELIVIILCLLIVGTHVTSIFTLYTDTMFYGKSVAYEFFEKKYIAITVRLITFLLFLFFNKHYYIIFMLIPVSWLLNKKYKHLTNAGWYVSTVISYGIGIYFAKLLRSI
ncbi:MAG: DUF3307 domain-containing protein [Endomicrobia bacterium]|nr:DUF3307 domain-containing protein [Endomicrobiia bacterium]